MEQLEEMFEDFSLERYPSVKEIKFKKVSEFPLIRRDLSFQTSHKERIDDLVRLIENYDNDILKETFMFDFYNDESKNLIKIGFRFIFQSSERTLTDSEVDNIIDDIVKSSFDIGDIKLPGYKVKND